MLGKMINFYHVILFISLLVYYPLQAQKDQLFIYKEPRLLVIQHHSSILGKDKVFRIFLPENREPEQLFPVLYVLHGAGCNSSAWPDQTQIDEMAANYAMILVFPDGETSWYLDHPQIPDMKYESYIIKELIPLIESTFPARNDKPGRAIMGASMGGYGAMMFAARYPEQFCSVSSFFGILTITGEIEAIAALLGPYQNDRDFLKKNSPFELASNYLNQELAILFDCGSEDQTSALIASRTFHQRLNELAIPHIWQENPGGHTADFLNAQLKEHLDFHWKNFTQKTDP